MMNIFKRLWLGILVICVASAVLLASDLHSRRKSTASKQQAKIAIVKSVSNSLLDEIEDSVIRGLQKHDLGKKRLTLTQYSAEGDIGTANAIARQVTDGSYSMIISISTVMLQAVAAANSERKTIHVFAGVTDPAGAGVGVERMDSTEKPPYLTGIGTFQPAEQIFHKAREFYPSLSIVGTVWNPAESNSEACLRKARAVTLSLNITLLEAPIEQARDIPEAAQSLIARGVEAIWAGCDATLNTGIGSLTAIAAKAGIPVFSNTGRHILQGSLFDLGADYSTVGEEAASIAAAILDGADPAQIPVTNFMPEQLMLNLKVLAGLRDPWAFPKQEVETAGLIIDEHGKLRETALKHALPFSRTALVRLIYYNESPLAEEALRGIRDGFRRAGLEEGRDYSFSVQSAQGDMATLNSIFDAARDNETDLYLVISTPTLQTALHKIRQTPIVFTVVADPFIVGAGKNDKEHLPHVTGVYTVGPYAELADMLVRYYPDLKRLGTLFSPAEANSVYNKDFFVREAKKRGLVVETVGVESTNEIPDAALALSSKGIDAFAQITDNLTAAGFSAIAHAAKSAKLPLFGTQAGASEQGAGITLTRDYYDAGLEAAEKAVAVLRGKSPETIPFSPPRTVKTLIHSGHATAMGLSLPPELLAQAVLVDASKNEPTREDPKKQK